MPVTGDKAYNRYQLKVLLLLVIISSISMPAIAQESFSDFYSKSQNINNTGMIVLGSWAVANMATGIYGWSNYSGEKMYFHQMNFFWNIVNASIAGFALYGNYTTDINNLTQQELLDKLINTERILLINAGLDVGYIGTGFLLRHLAATNEKRPDLLKGYGNSLILQGGFLLIFDLALYGILRADRMSFLSNIDIAMIPDGFRVGLNIPF